jgi:hypothetical protein
MLMEQCVNEPTPTLPAMTDFVLAGLGYRAD